MALLEFYNDINVKIANKLYCWKTVSEIPKINEKTALQLHLEGLGIGRILEVSNVTVLNWIHNFGEEAQPLHLHSESKEIEMVESDEIHSYIRNKKTIVGLGLLLIDMEKDSSTSLLVTEARE